MNTLNLESENRCFGGTVAIYSHYAETCQSMMRFAVFIPPQAQSKPVPVLYYLSGLTCTEENFTVKAGAQRYAAETGIMLVAPDTSPRNTGIEGEDEDWDLGTGAGFYVDATQDPWQKHYRMYSYIVEELPDLIASHFPIMRDRRSIFGHSMGGHGALICALKNPDKYRSVSAFAPITAPSRCPWGEKAFSAYLGDNREIWREYDASEIIKTNPWQRPILIDQGDADSFLAQNQLLPDVFAQVCETVGQPLTLRYQKGYDHSYFFIASFIGDHIRYHAQALGE